MPNNEFGDFATPPELASRIAALLDAGRYPRVLEPTCGRGSFLEAVRAQAGDADQDRIGVEIQPGHARAAAAHGTVLQRDVFRLALDRELPWTRTGPLLVVGNPPWVTSADLTRFGSSNVPVKTNRKGLRGLEARTGSANFDVAEYVWTKLVEELAPQHPTIALLCKTQVARAVLAHCASAGLPVDGGRLYTVDSMRWFGAAVDAGLFVLHVRPGARDYTCTVHASLDAGPGGRFGVVDGRLVSDLDGYVATRAADGECPFVWRQGVKHDAAAVMELVPDDGGTPRTRAGDAVVVEEGFLYPLVKSTDLFRGRTRDPGRWMVVPQRRLADDTDTLRTQAPRLWEYLSANGSVLDGRRSSIYRSRPRFCVFGVGDYTFAPYKVAVSGLHKRAEFRLLAPHSGRPVVLDDTCYFLPFDDVADAAVCCAVLRSEPATTLVESLVFWDSKRPVTKRLLQRLDVRVLAGLLDPPQVLAAAAALAREATGAEPAATDLDQALASLGPA